MRAGVQHFAVRVRELVEEDARRAVELRDDDALGAVDDEGAAVGDERQLAEVDLLLDHVLVALDPVHFLAREQAQPRLQRRRVGQVALHALVHGVLGLADRRRPRTRATNSSRGSLMGNTPANTSCRPSFRRRSGSVVQLEEVAEALELDLEQVRESAGSTRGRSCEKLFRSLRRAVFKAFPPFSMGKRVAAGADSLEPAPRRTVGTVPPAAGSESADAGDQPKRAAVAT